MFPQTAKSWYDYRALNQNWCYQPTMAGRASHTVGKCDFLKPLIHSQII